MMIHICCQQEQGDDTHVGAITIIHHPQSIIIIIISIIIHHHHPSSSSSFITIISHLASARSSNGRKRLWAWSDAWCRMLLQRYDMISYYKYEMDMTLQDKIHMYVCISWEVEVDDKHATRYTSNIIATGVPPWSSYDHHDHHMIIIIIIWSS